MRRIKLDLQNHQDRIEFSKKELPQNIMKDILNIIPHKNRYAKSYLSLAIHIFDDYDVIKVTNANPISNILFYKKYGIKLNTFTNFEKFISENLNLQSNYV